MHIPDGFLSPQTYLPGAGLAFGALAWAGRDLRRRLDESLIPRLAVLTALAYGLGLVMLPLPGATSGHVVGIALLALLFGWRLAFLAEALVLLLQSLLFGAGGITAWPLNLLAIGGVGGGVAVLAHRLLKGWNETAAVAAAAWLSVMASAAVVGAVLGLQPLIAQAPDGSPRFFPLGWAVVLPAVLLPHALIGVAEAALTVTVWRHARRRGWAGTA